MLWEGARPVTTGGIIGKMEKVDSVDHSLGCVWLFCSRNFKANTLVREPISALSIFL